MAEGIRMSLRWLKLFGKKLYYPARLFTEAQRLVTEAGQDAVRCLQNHHGAQPVDGRKPPQATRVRQGGGCGSNRAVNYAASST